MKLTRREKQIVKLMADDLHAAQIASELNISVKTVEAHGWNIKRKNGLKTASGVVGLAFRTKKIE